MRRKQRRKPAARDWSKERVDGVPFRVHQLIRDEMSAWDAMPADCRKALEMEKYHEPPMAIGMLQAIKAGTNWRLFLDAFRKNSKTLYERDLANATRRIKEQEDARELSRLDAAAEEASYYQSLDPPRRVDDALPGPTRNPPAERRALPRSVRKRLLSLLLRRDGA